MKKQSVLSIAIGSLGILLAAAATAAGVPDTVTGTASAGLVQLATTGNPEGLQQELGGQIVPSSAVSDAVGRAALDGLLDVAREEHLAPKALVAPTGEIYAMVAPTITKDNFVLVTNDGSVRRMDVGDSEGTHRPFEVAVIDPTELPPTVTGTASAGLTQLATTGNPEGLHAELGGEIQDSDVIAATIGRAKLDGLLDVAQEEHLAPKALVAPTGEIYAMVAPTITKDNFILVTADGTARRMDVGASEGTHRPFRVATIVGDGGTPWYTEFYYWLSGR